MTFTVVGGGDLRVVGGDAEPVPGRVVIADAVVAKLAAQAAVEHPHAGGAAPRILGVNMPGGGKLGIRASSLSTKPKATADVDGSIAYIDVSMSVRWPESVAEVTARVRDRVRRRVQELTGLTVATVTITVRDLIVEE